MKRVSLALAAVLLVACATPYHERGWANLGVDAAPMGGDLYRVQARLNIFSDQARVQDFLMLRAAETAQANGAIGFVILGTQDTTEHSTLIIPGTATTTGSAYGAGNSVYGSATTTYMPAQVSDMSAPGGIMMIRLVRAPVPEGLHYLKAAEVIAAVGSRVR
ncbi:MAG TPA: hypothetical protein DHW63_00815 [Hyphomonadaceae bacterium]|nr:hypothetical protein [Hyphomonadaceae bacterium]